MSQKLNSAACLVFLLLSCCALTYAQAPQLEQHSISAMDGGLKLTFSFNQKVETYVNSVLSVTPYKMDGTADFPTQPPPLTPLAGNKIEFLFPSAKLKDVSAIEYRLTLRDGTGIQAYQSSLLKLDAGPISEYGKRVEEISKLNSQLMSALADAAQKQQLLNSYGTVQATQIEFKNVAFATDAKLVLAYKLDAAGAIKVKLTSTSNPPVISPREFTTSFGAPTIVVFDKLVSGEKYRVEADIVRVGAKPGENLMMNKTNVQEVSTEKPADPISLSGISAEAEGDTIKVSFASTADGLVQIKYAQKIDDFSEGTPLYRGQITKDDNGKPQGGEKITVAGPNVFSLDHVQTGKKYAIEIIATNKHGFDSLPKSAVVTITATKALAFDSSQPLSATITPLGITLDWKATIKPKDASFIVLFDNKTWSGGKTETIGDDLLISLTLPVQKLGEVLANTNDDKKKNDPKPILRAQMTDAKTGKTINQDIRLAYSIPTKPEVDKARADGAITEQTKRDLYSVIENAVPSKNVNWGKLISTGLSILFKFI